ncbi:Acyl-CoA:lysophosphatidylglycerol acyltransferase 1 [Branchiostoma belcheri]|nr:Acyl-CoA:lysophosphatidylglycerol acyltransferase 1 [Branchiostoma belcheri]
MALVDRVNQLLVWLLPWTWYLLRIALRLAFITVNNLYVIPAHFVWLLCLQPVRILRPELFWRLEGIMFKWLLAQVGYWGYSAGYQMYECGEDISHTYSDEAIVIVNHQSTADVATLMAALQHKGPVVRRMMWIMDYIFLYSNFGWCAWAHGDFFLQQGQQYREVMLKLLKDHLKTRYLNRNHQWIILFPEGGFLRKRRERSQKYAKKHNLPVLQHVALPRIGAMKTILDNAGPPLAQRNGPLQENEWQTTGHTDPYVSMENTISYHTALQVPRDEEGLTKWLYKRFEEKEELLSHFYSTGQFPPGTTRPGTKTTDKAVETFNFKQQECTNFVPCLWS